MNTFLGFKTEEILTCLLLVIVGYFIAKMFSQKCNGFSVGIQALPSDGAKCTTKCKARVDSKYQYDCPKSGSCYKLVEDNGQYCVEPENLTGTSKNKYCISGRCNKNGDCKSGICHKDPITQTKNCVNKCSDLSTNACHAYPDKCKLKNKKDCISKNN